MARKPRIEFPGALFHVFSRGNQKQKVFLDDQDCETFIKRLVEYKNEYGFSLYAYTLMKNHFHLLIEMHEVKLSKIMQGLLQSYTQYFNLKYKKVGHVFQGRYKAFLCESDIYLLQLIRYLHLNCVRSGYVKHPDDFKWSSHGHYLKGTPSVVDVDKGLNYFSKERSIAVKKYRIFINDGLNLKDKDDFYAVVDQRFLGSEGFVDEVKQMFEKEAEDSPAPTGVDMDKIWMVIEGIFGVKKEDILGRARDNRLLCARSAFVHLAKYSGKKGFEIAQEIKRDPAVVTTLTRLGNVEFKKEIDRCINELNSITQV